jgi:anti-sigma factor ChrR (cupin superfamily)
MSEDLRDQVEFDEIIALALAQAAAEGGEAPRPEVRARLLSRIRQADVQAVPPGFTFTYASDQTWVPHPVPGIRMKVLSASPRESYVTLLLDVEPGTRFPAHHHSGDEECYVISGDVHTWGRELGPGDFLHADAGTDHTELWTENGATVLLIVPREELGEYA